MLSKSFTKLALLLFLMRFCSVTSATGYNCVRKVVEINVDPYAVALVGLFACLIVLFVSLVNYCKHHRQKREMRELIANLGNLPNTDVLFMPHAQQGPPPKYTPRSDPDNTSTHQD